MHHTELRRRRDILGLTQEQLARYLDVAPNTIARWERGELTIARPLILRKMLDLAEDDPEIETLRQATPRRGRPPKQHASNDGH